MAAKLDNPATTGPPYATMRCPELGRIVPSRS